MGDCGAAGEQPRRLAASAVILSGGTARRMGGAEKGLLPAEGTTFIGRKISVLEDAGVSEIIIVTNNPGTYAPYCGPKTTGSGGVPVAAVTDDYPNAGVLAALYTGLKACRYAAAFATTADTPFLRGGLARLLIRMLGPADAVVPRINGGIEPLCAAYSTACLEYIGPCLRRGEKKIRSFYPDAEVLYAGEESISSADPGGESFININSWEDYYAYFTADGRRV
jgi:molybdopterin-guanine dinucleotide biosynthesis protein A